MADKIKQFFAPTQELRSSPAAAAAWETAARRIGPAYQDIARNEKAQGQIAADLFKQELWPMNIAKLYEQQSRDALTGAASDARKLASQNIGFRVRGVNDTFGGPTETFSEDPTRDFDAAGHAQVSRGAGALGRALGDGGYALARQVPSSGYPGQQEIDAVTGLPVYSRDYTAFNKAQDAMREYNRKTTLEPAQEDYERKIADNAVRGPNIEGPSNFPGTYGYSSSDPSVSQVNVDNPSSGGFFSGLRNFISNIDLGSTPGNTGGM